MTAKAAAAVEAVQISVLDAMHQRRLVRLDIVMTTGLLLRTMLGTSLNRTGTIDWTMLAASSERHANLTDYHGRLSYHDTINHMTVNDLTRL